MRERRRKEGKGGKEIKGWGGTRRGGIYLKIVPPGLCSAPVVARGRQLFFPSQSWQCR